MAVYYINFALVLGLAYPLCVYKPSNIKKMAYLAVTFGYMWFLATFRYEIGFDYYAYFEIMEYINILSVREIIAWGYYEHGFALLTKLISLFTVDTTAMYGIYTLLIFAPVAWFIYKYCANAWLSTWLYVSLAFFYGSMNFIRQNLAIGVSILGYKFLREKKPIPYFIVIIAAALFHKTALIMIPVYFLVHIKLTRKVTIAYASLTLVAFLTSEIILDIVTDYMFTDYKGTDWLTLGFSTVFLVVPFAMFGGCIALRGPWLKRDAYAPVLFNLMMFSSIIWLFITRHFVVERFSHYMYIYAILAVPAALASLKPAPEEYEKLKELQVKGGKSKEAMAKIKDLSQSISDRKKYYWSAVTALVAITYAYIEFAAVNGTSGFHGVFPYRTILWHAVGLAAEQLG